MLLEVTARIIDPLGMQSTDIIDPADVAVGHSLVDETFVVRVPLDPSTGGAAGGLESTGRDLLVFADALHEGQLLSPESRDAMESFVPGEDLSAFGVTHSYGLGLERYHNDSITVLGHLGSSDAWGAFIGFDRASGNAVAVAINSNNAGPQAVIALEALLALAAS